MHLPHSRESHKAVGYGRGREAGSTMTGLVSAPLGARCRGVDAWLSVAAVRADSIILLCSAVMDAVCALC